MNTITASSLVSVLEHDPLYSDNSIALKVSNHLAIKNKIIVHFFGYLYGSKFDVVRSAKSRLRYNDADEVSKRSPCDFIPIPRRYMEQIAELNSEIKSFGGQDMDLLSDALLKKKEVVEGAKEENNIYAHLVTIFIVTGMRSMCLDKVNTFDVKSFKDFVGELHDEILLEALDSVFFAESDIIHYFTSNVLPLPVALFPVEDYNSNFFMQSCPAGLWDKYDPVEHFKIFYNTSIKTQYQQKQIVSKASPSNSSNPSLEESEEVVNGAEGCGVKYAFYKCGDFWEVVYKGSRHSIKDVVGLMYIHYIILSGEKGVTIDELNALKESSKEIAGANLFDDKNKTNEQRNSRCFKGGSKIKPEKIREAIEGIENEIEDLKSQMNDGRLSMEDCIDAVSLLEEQKKEIYKSGRPDADKNYTRMYDRITKNINAAQSRIEKHNKQLYVHLMPACTPKRGVFCYTNPGDVDWKLFGE